MTRVTTRLNAEEMTFDPSFVPAEIPALEELVLEGVRETLLGCEDAVLSTDGDEFRERNNLQYCATTYCGDGRCAGTASGAGCTCDAGHVGRSFTNLDGEASITCVPDVYPVDFSLSLIHI